MDTIAHRAFADFACRLAAVARDETLPRWRSAGAARNKAADGGFDPVTEADVAAERAMRARIEQAWPDHGILGEELAGRPARSPYCWSLDPIDGTRAYICGLPTWTTLIALLEDGAPIVGVIDAPRLGELYVGGAGEARLISAEDEASLKVSACCSLAEARLTTTDPGLFEGAEADGFDRVRARARLTRYGHDAYGYARLAAGSIDLVVESGLKPHDYNALVPVIRGAGGVVGNWRGGDDLSGGAIVAAATQELYEEAVAMLGV